MLLIFGGLPAVGKSTLAKALVPELNAVYLRVDTIEHALINAGTSTKDSMADQGYRTAYAIALENLKLGMTVIADSVNPLKETRQAWLQIAISSRMPYLEIEIICSDLLEHQKRAETRYSDISDLTLPTWKDIQAREFESWQSNQLIVDTSKLSISQALDKIKDHLRTRFI